MVFGEILVRVAGLVGGLFGGGEGLVAGELAARGDGYLFRGLVARLRGQVLDFADERFAVQDFAEDDVLSVQVRGRDRGDEELRAVGAFVLLSALFLRSWIVKERRRGNYLDQHWPWTAGTASRA